MGYGNVWRIKVLEAWKVGVNLVYEEARGEDQDILFDFWLFAYGSKVFSFVWKLRVCNVMDQNSHSNQ